MRKNAVRKDGMERKSTEKEDAALSAIVPVLTEISDTGMEIAMADNTESTDNEIVTPYLYPMISLMLCPETVLPHLPLMNERRNSI